MGKTILIILTITFLLSGCATEDFSPIEYDTLKQHNESLNAEIAVPPAPTVRTIFQGKIVDKD